VSATRTVAQAIREAALAIAANNSDQLSGAAQADMGRFDAELLMAHALGVIRAEMFLRKMAEPAPAAFAGLLARRLAHEPVAYILGTGHFYGLELAVSPAVLIPRPDSETLIDAARDHFAALGTAPARILDLGTGSGSLLLAALSLWPEAEGVGIERSAEARSVAARNAARHAPDARILAGDWTQPGWRDGLGRFDLVLANPPYVEEDAELAPSVRAHEPHAALFAGAAGMDDYAVLVPQLPGLLAPGGLAVVEIGHTQAEPVAALAEAHGFVGRLHRDLAGRPRALAMTYNTGSRA